MSRAGYCLCCLSGMSCIKHGLDMYFLPEGALGRVKDRSSLDFEQTLFGTGWCQVSLCAVAQAPR